MNQTTRNTEKVTPALEAEWFSLVQDGMTGQSSAFRLRLTRLVARLRREGSPLADTLAKAMSQHALGHGLEREARPTLGHELQPVDSETKLALTTVEYPVDLGEVPIWTHSISKGLRDVEEEWRHAGQLQAAGLRPSCTLLLSGPPGVGKTMAARYLAQKLDLPLLTLNLAGSINSHLGRTGSNLVRVLAAGQSKPCILFLDEFDALAKSRGDAQDVGELKRVVNVLLQAIDRWPSHSLLMAATNHADLLDHAIFRRFDLWLQFENTSIEQVRAVAAEHGCPPALLEGLAKKLVGRPLSDIVRIMSKARRLSLLRNISLAQAIGESSAMLLPDEPANDAATVDYHRVSEAKRLHSTGLSQRAIATAMGISHSTVHRLLKLAKGERHG